MRPLIHGSTYFRALYDAIEAAQAGDLLFFTDWQGDADERLTGEPGSEVVEVLGRADERGVDVRGLVWRSHSTGPASSRPRTASSASSSRSAAPRSLLDMRVRTGGSHHQKFVVIRHRDDPDPRRRLRRWHRPLPLPPRRRRPRRRPAAAAAHRGVRRAPAVARRPGRDPGAGGPRRRDRLPRALGGPDPAVPGARRPDSATGSAGSTPRPTRCRSRRPPPPRGRRSTSSSCCAPTRTCATAATTRSPAAASAAWPAATPRRWRGPERLIYVEDQYLWGHHVGRRVRPSLREHTRPARWWC